MEFKQHTWELCHVKYAIPYLERLDSRTWIQQEAPRIHNPLQNAWKPSLCEEGPGGRRRWRIGAGGGGHFIHCPTLGSHSDRGNSLHVGASVNGVTEAWGSVYFEDMDTKDRLGL